MRTRPSSTRTRPAILDRTLRLDTDLYRIVGVMPPGFYAPSATAAERNTEVWAATSLLGPPLQSQPPRNGRNLPDAIARLKPGLTLAAAQAGSTRWSRAGKNNTPPITRRKAGGPFDWCRSRKRSWATSASR